MQRTPPGNGSSGSAAGSAAFAALFFLSGAAGLVYQIVWARALVVVFGASVAAVATVIGAFMAGLALGAWVFGRIADRTRDNLRLYAALELSIGLAAVALPSLLDALAGAVPALWRALEPQPGLFAAVRFALVFGLLLVPTTLMGATLPVLARAVVRERAHLGRDVSRLYAANTFGAAAGSVLVALVLLERLGVRQTLLATAAVNALVAAVAFALSLARGRHEQRGVAAPPVPSAIPTTAPRVARLVLAGFALSGAAAVGYEVLWTRALAIELRLTTTESLSAMLVVFLCGLACGGAAGTRLADRFRHPALAFAAVQLLLALAALSSVPALASVPRMMAALGPAWGWAGHALRVHAVGFAVMLLPTFLMGLCFPIASRVHVEGRKIGAGLGAVYAANTAGAVAGPFVAGFLLLPRFGVQHAIQLLALTHVVVGAAILAVDGGWSARIRGTLLAGLGASVVLLVTLVPSDAVVGAFGPRQGRLVHHDEDVAGTVTVVEFPDGGRLLRVNGAGEVPTDLDSIRTFRLLGNLPMVLHPAPERVLVIAFGAGITLDAVDRHRPARLSCVEIAPAVVGAAPLFERYNGGVWRKLDAGQIRLVRQDGRNHLLSTAERYDAIIGDATHPATADSWVLYTREFYELCRSRLATGGVFAQWLPLHGLTAEDYRTILRTFRSAFPHASLWLTPGYSVLVASPGPLAPDLGRIGEALDRAAVQEGLEEVGLGDPLSLLGTLALDERALELYAGEGPVNTDDLPRVGFGDRTRSGTTHGVPVLVDLLPHLVATFDGPLGGADASSRARLDRRLAARRHTMAGVLSRTLGRRDEALRAFRRALEIDGSEPEARRLLETLAGTDEFR
jgi:spermidine synthase